MRDLAQIVADNERAAARELAEAWVDAEHLRLRSARWMARRESILTDDERESLGLPRNARPLAVEVVL